MIKSIFEKIEKETIDDYIKNIFDIWYERNISRFITRFTDLFIKLIQRPFYQMFFKQLDKKTEIKLLAFLEMILLIQRINLIMNYFIILLFAIFK